MIAQRQPRQEQLGQQLMQELRALWEAAGGMKDGEALEMAVQAWQRGLGRRVMEALCQEAIRGREQQAPVCCQQPMDNHSRQARTVKTLLGDVRVRRRYYRCLVCGASSYPADGWLGWKGGFSHRVQEAVAWECSLVPYRQARESLAKLAGLEVSVDGAEGLVRRWGEAELVPSPYAERVEKELVIEIDGSKAHLEDGWREIKVGACFSWDGDHPDRDPEAVSYCADWESAERFRETLWQEAVSRGVTTARSLAVIGDGAPWIWELASEIFPWATQILDWYHLSEHLWTAAKIVHGDGTPETTALVEQWKTEVQEGRSEGVEEHLRELVAAGKDDRDKTLRRCADYLQTHQARLRYHLFRAMGWPIGSGVVEGACKHVVGLRFKRQSTRWTKAGARAVLHLRLDRLNSRWERRSEHLRQQLRKAA
jgi:hypothetical protein